MDAAGVSASLPKPCWLIELFQFIGSSASIEWFIYSSNSNLLVSYFLNGPILHVISF